MTEMVEYTRRICDAVDIPVFTDGNTGYGNVTNVFRTVKEMERAGAAGMFIEDQVYPKRMGYWGPEAHKYKRTKYLIPTQEMTIKLKAALKMRNSLDPDFVLFARTDAYGAVGGGLDEAIERCKAYWDAGVDGLMIFPSEEPTLELLNEVRKRLPPPIRVDAGLASTKFSVRDYERMGFNTCGLHNQTAVVAFKFVRDFLMEVKKAGKLPGSYNAYMAETRRIINDLTGMPDLRQIEREQEEAMGLPKTM